MIRALSQRDKCRFGVLLVAITLLEMPLLARSPVYNTPERFTRRNQLEECLTHAMIVDVEAKGDLLHPRRRLCRRWTWADRFDRRGQPNQ